MPAHERAKTNMMIEAGNVACEWSDPVNERTGKNGHGRQLAWQGDLRGFEITNDLCIGRLHRSVQYEVLRTIGVGRVVGP